MDTSILIAVLSGWHEAHEKSKRLLNEYLEAEASLILPAHVLLETYSVLTRLPLPHRLKASDALQLITANLTNFSQVAGISGASVVTLETGDIVRVKGQKVLNRPHVQFREWSGRKPGHPRLGRRTIREANC